MSPKNVTNKIFQRLYYFISTLAYNDKHITQSIEILTNALQKVDSKKEKELWKTIKSNLNTVMKKHDELFFRYSNFILEFSFDS